MTSPLKPPTAKPDFNTDVLWKPPRMGTRMRSESITSSEGSSMSSDSPSSPTGRRFSISEMIFGPKTSLPNSGIGGGTGAAKPMLFQKQASVDESGDLSPTSATSQSSRFEEFVRRQKHLLDDH